MFEFLNEYEGKYKFQNAVRMIEIVDLVENGVYLVDSRNFKVAIYRDEAFHGIRHKFGQKFMDREFHWDTGAPFGTVKPIELLEIYTGP